jgi:flagellar basal body-associated protein FliL
MSGQWKLVRLVGFVLLALAAVISFVMFRPKSTSTADHSPQIAAALSDDTTNAKSASSAPQQQVVNGWTARDLLAVQAATANDQLAVARAGSNASRQIAALLLIAVLALCWGGATAGLGRDGESQAQSSETEGDGPSDEDALTGLPSTPTQ